MTLLGYRLPDMSSLLIWAALWELVGQLKLTFFVPPISTVIVTLFKLLPTPAFLNALGTTAYAFWMGVAFAIVIGIPVGTELAGGLDSLLSMVQMPGDVPVATVGVGPGGARNAGLLAVQILALADTGLRQKLLDYKERLVAKVAARNEALRKKISGQSS